MYKTALHSLIIVGLIFLAGCSNTRHLAKGEKLYAGHQVMIKSDSIKKGDAKILRTDLTGMLRPRPNTKLLGIRFKLFIYNLAGKPKKAKGGLRNIIRRFGEPPVLASSVDVQKNDQILQNRLENLGYFHAIVKGDTTSRNRKVTAKYTAQPGPQYHIRKVHFPSDSSDLGKAIAVTAEKTLLTPGEAYNLDVIKGERTRIDQSLKEQGFYFFGPDYLIARVDSTGGNHIVDFFMTVKPTTPPRAKEIYRINDVFIYPNYDLTKTDADTSKTNAVLFDGFHVIDKDKMFKPKVFSRSMFFDPGDVYNRREHNLALNRLVTLGSFKFVNNRFETIPTADSAKLDAYYYLTPYPRKSFRAEITGTTKSNNQTGTQVNLTWRNRNTFRGAEQLSVTAYTGLETQVSGTQRGYGTIRFGGEGTLSFPTFLVPFKKDINTNNEFVPHTKLNLGYEYLNKRQLYGINSFRGSVGYDWKSSLLRQHELYPISINYVQPSKITQQYQDSIDNNPELATSLLKPIEQQFIIGSTYSFLFNNQPQITRNNHIYFNATADVSGNIAGLISGANAKTGDYRTLFGSRFSQYIRLDGDFRYYYKLGRNSQLANRIFTGFGLPYGNSVELPFVKQYFTGGSSSIRAFRSRSVGPGTFRPSDASTSNFLPEQSGDIKLELNTEYRAKISGIINGAIFLDAGNVWLYNENPGKPGSKFSGSFLKELAAGAGAGLRFDLTFLIIRTDLAFPIRKPWLPEGQRSVIDQINFASRNWRKENLVFNLAIGYPF